MVLLCFDLPLHSSFLCRLRCFVFGVHGDEAETETGLDLFWGCFRDGFYLRVSRIYGATFQRLRAASLSLFSDFPILNGLNARTG